MTNRGQRCQSTAEHFSSLYRYKPQFIAVAPGRVNIIGEHVDHQDYSVLPSALNHTIQVAIGTSQHDDILTIHHVDSKRFPPITFNTFNDLKVASNAQWTNYVIASLFGVIEYKVDPKSVGKLISRCAPMEGSVATMAKTLLPKTGMQLLVDGTVPIAAGVSSSSALVVAAAIAFSRCLKVDMTRIILADVCSNSERHVGTAGGGMDQAAICLCERGSARLIHFNPLKSEAVPLPSDGVLVVCNSCCEAAKAVHAATQYNKRVFELKLGGYLILKGKFANEEIDPQKISTLKLKSVQEKLGVGIKEVVEMAKKYIPEGPMSKNEAKRILGQERLEQLLKYVGAGVWERNTYFEPLRRILHVCSETQRVNEFVDVCRNTTMPSEEKLKSLGKLMDASNESLTLLFDCGSPELSEVVELAHKFGAYGSRLTGAGWGGCTVSLVHKNNVDVFLEKMRSYFIRPDRLVPINVPSDISTALFAVNPDDGACIFSAKGNEYQQINWS